VQELVSLPEEERPGSVATPITPKAENGLSAETSEPENLRVEAADPPPAASVEANDLPLESAEVRPSPSPPQEKQPENEAEHMEAEEEEVKEKKESV